MTERRDEVVVERRPVFDESLAVAAPPELLLAEGGEAVRRDRLAFLVVKAGITAVPLGGAPVDVPLTQVDPQKKTVFFPVIDVTGVRGTGAKADVEATILYRRPRLAAVTDVLLRLRNTGDADADVAWEVHTFAP